MGNLIKCEKGFTLAEMLVAITILAISLLAVAGMQITAIGTNSDSNTLTAATALTEGIMEEILAWDVDTPVLNSSSSGNLWDFFPETAGVQSTRTFGTAGTYSATYSVVANANGVTNLTQITVVVTGIDSGNSNRSITLVGFKRLV
ncbi:prepilin-type N-terminal cleavage/methylation domain-containing protein [Desulfuromonas sp. TF]|uniref:type IV pilus modification PilV family protein n=1 Tax=Desulfuromonas sp. TF TaxID=1232410 RepID=UPI0004276463|nr:prepilin-type N-terminal cleavage/methylation domain-containing protein [Desulfuromonas sp. TF]